MYALRKFFNYATLVLAIFTIGITVLVICHKLNAMLSIIFMAITLIFNGISRIYNDRDLNLTKDDKEFLKNSKEKNNK